MKVTKFPNEHTPENNSVHVVRKSWTYEDGAYGTPRIGIELEEVDLLPIIDEIISATKHNAQANALARKIRRILC